MFKKLKNRYTIFGIVVFLMFSVLVYRLENMQIENGSAYFKESEQKKVRTLSVSGPRGKIFDRNGKVLATYRQGYKLELLVSEVSKDQLNSVIQNAIHIVESCGDTYQNDLLIQYIPGEKTFDWNTKGITTWKSDNQIPSTYTAYESFQALVKKYDIPANLSFEQQYEITSLRNQINSADSESNTAIAVTSSLDQSVQDSLAPIIKQYQSVLSIAKNKDGSVLNVIPSMNNNTFYNNMCLQIIKTVPEKYMTATNSFPMKLLGNTVDWSTSELKTWKKNLNLSDSLTASESFSKLKTKYKIPDSYSQDDVCKVMSTRVAIDNLGYLAYYPVVIASDINQKTIAKIEENSYDLPGLNIGNEYIRQYPNSTMLAQTLGTMGKITAADASQYKSQGYDLSSDLVGRTGLEYTMEKYLRSVPGKQTVQVNMMGRVINTLSQQAPVPGNNVYLTIDSDLQKVAEESLADTITNIQKGTYGHSYPNAKVGAVVVTDIHSGEILALASYPTFDPNLFANGTISTKLWNDLNPKYYLDKDKTRENNDPTLPRPMLNNAVSATFPPGSTFKMVVGAAGLKEGTITPSTIIVDKGRFTKYGEANAPACWIWNEYHSMHGPENIIGAIRDSCNYYFYTVGDELGIQKIDEYAKFFGLGVKTGIELPNEAQGTVAGPDFTNKFISTIITEKIKAYMKTKYNRDLTNDEIKKAGDMSIKIMNNPSVNSINSVMSELDFKKNGTEVMDIYTYIRDNQWMPGKTLNAAIGQGEHSFSVVQMSNYIASLINGEDRYKPHIVEKVNDADGKTILQKSPEVIQKISFNSEIHNSILEGMGEVTSDNGTAGTFFKDFPIKVGGKTGSAQKTGQDAYAWFVGFAPYNDPKIAVAVVIPQGGAGSYAAPVAKAIFSQYLGLNKPADAKTATPTPTPSHSASPKRSTKKPVQTTKPVTMPSQAPVQTQAPAQTPAQTQAPTPSNNGGGTNNNQGGNSGGNGGNTGGNGGQGNTGQQTNGKTNP